MNPLLASAALGLLVAWPAAGLGWALGTLSDKLTRDPGPRDRVWGFATALAPSALALTVGAALMPGSLTAPVQKITLVSNMAVGATAAFSQVSEAAPLVPEISEVLARGLVLGAFGGLVVAVARQVIGLLRLRAIVRDAIPAQPDLTLAVRDAARRLGCVWPDVRLSEDVQQPLLAGLFKPVILLPADLSRQLETEQLLPICVHELAHLKRHDNWRLLIEGLSAGLFWMAAPQGALHIRAAAVREERCDGIALEGADARARRRYAENLVRALRAQSTPELQPAFTGKSRRSIAMRLEAIAKPQAPASTARKAALGALAVLIATLTAGGAMALAQKKIDRASYGHSTVSDDDGLLIDIVADEVRRVRPPQAKDRFGAPIDRTIYSGDVKLKLRPNTAATRILLNGATPPAGFDPSNLPRGSIKTLELTNYESGAAQRMVLNVIM